MYDYIKKRPVKVNINSDILQLDLFKGDYNLRYYRTITGYFFELLASTLFGGMVNRGNGNSDENYIPDIIFPDKNIEVEVKSVRKWGEFNISTDQFDFYINRFSDVRYCLFKTNIEGYDKVMKGKSREEVFQMLANNVMFCWYMPISLMLQLKDSENYVTSYEGNRWEPLFRITSRAITDMLKYNPLVILKRMEIKTGQFRIYQRYSPMIKIDGIEVNSFPILWIKDRGES